MQLNAWSDQEKILDTKADALLYLNIGQGSIYQLLKPHTVNLSCDSGTNSLIITLNGDGTLYLLSQINILSIPKTVMSGVNKVLSMISGKSVDLILSLTVPNWSVSNEQYHRVGKWMELTLENFSSNYGSIWEKTFTLSGSTKKGNLTTDHISIYYSELKESAPFVYGKLSINSGNTVELSVSTLLPKCNWRYTSIKTLQNRAIHDILTTLNGNGQPVEIYDQVLENLKRNGNLLSILKMRINSLKLHNLPTESTIKTTLMILMYILTRYLEGC